MMRFRFSRMLMFSACLSVRCLLSAQTPEPESPPPPVTVRLVCLSTSGDLEDVRIPVAPGKWLEPRIPATYLPDPIEYTGPNPVTFWREGRDEEGNPVPVRIASVPIPEDREEILFLIGPNRGNDAAPRHDVMTMNFNPDRFPEQSYWLINLCRERLMGTIADTAFSLQPQAHKVVSPGMGANGEGVLQVRLALDGELVNKSRLSTLWFNHPGNRELVVFSNDPLRPHVILISTYSFL